MTFAMPLSDKLVDRATIYSEDVDFAEKTVNLIDTFE
jgi:hypothetical protein